MADNKLRILLQFLADKTGLTSATKGISAVVTASRKASAAVKATFDGLKSGLTKIRNFGIVAGAALAGAVRETVQFNVGLARAWTMAGGGIGVFMDLRKEVKNLATDFGLAKSELTSGLYQALSAGVPKENAIDFLRTASKVAVADGSELTTAVDGITTILNAFGLEAGRTGDVVDAMFKTVAKGKTTFGELAANISVAAPLASTLGVNFDQVLAAVATLTKQGVPTAVAMTQIRAAMLSVNDVLGDGWSKSMTLSEAFSAVADQAGGSQTKLREMVGRVEAMSGILGLTGKNATMAAEDMAALTDRAGTLDEAFGKVDQFREYSKLWQETRNIIDSIGSALRNSIAPAIRSITADLKEWRNTTDIFDKLEGKLNQLREKVKDIWTAVTEGGQAQQFFSAIKNLFIGSLKLAGEKLVEILLVAAPMIGAAIGHAIKAAATNLNPFAAAGKWIGAQDAAMADPGYARQPGETRTDMAARRWDMIQRYKKDIETGRLRNQGLELSGQFAQDTNPELAAAFAGFDKVARKGQDMQLMKQAEATVIEMLLREQDVLELMKRLSANQQSMSQDLQQLKSQVKYGPRR